VSNAFHMTRLLPGRDFDDTIRALTAALSAEGSGRTSSSSWRNGPRGT
jgi:hypothetical protein